MKNMIVEDNRETNKTIFACLCRGDVFVMENKFFIKTGTIDALYGQAWSLDDNLMYNNIPLNETVQKVNAKIVIYD